MKKISGKLLIFLLVLIIISGCEQERKPQIIYPYTDLNFESINKIQFFTAQESTPWVDDKTKIQELTKLINNSKFVRYAGNEGGIGTCGWGVMIQLNEKVSGSNNITLCYTNGEGKELRIGPQGYEFVIESQELGNFILRNLNHKFAIVTNEILPDEISNWFNSFNNEKGAYIYQHPENTYIKINSGNHLGVDIKDFINEDFNKQIVISFNNNNFPNSIILRLNSDYITNYEVKTMEATPLKTKEKVILSHLQLPQEGAIVDNFVRVKGKIAVFEGSFVVRITDDKGQIIKETIIQTEGAPKWGAFDEKIELPTPTTIKGILTIGSYSPKDGNFIPYESRNIKFKD